MILKYIGIIILTLTCACSNVPLKPHIIAADKVTNPFIRNAKQKHGLSVLGTGGKMMYEVEEIYVGFTSCGAYSLSQARQHFLSIFTPFVEDIRNSSELKQYLLYPDQPEKAASISIIYILPNNQDPKPPLIGHVFTLNGKVFYSVNDQINGRFRRVHEETYQQALEIVNCTN